MFWRMVQIMSDNNSEALGFSVVDDRPDFVVVNKCEGIDFHDCDGVLGLFSRVKKTLQLTELYPVHRLDKVTSGLVIFAKNASANQEFCRLFSEQRIEKYYLAIAYGKPKKKQGAVRGDMARGRRSAWKILKTQNNPALTQFFSFSLCPGFRLYLLKPFTGKTHQLRVALKSLGVAILGDPLYAGGDEGKSKSDGKGMVKNYKNTLLKRTYLHAYVLRFRFGGEYFCYLNIPKTGDSFLNFQPDAESLFQEMQKSLLLTEPWQQLWPKILRI